MIPNQKQRYHRKYAFPNQIRDPIEQFFYNMAGNRSLDLIDGVIIKSLTTPLDPGGRQIQSVPKNGRKSKISSLLCIFDSTYAKSHYADASRF